MGLGLDPDSHEAGLTPHIITNLTKEKVYRVKMLTKISWITTNPWNCFSKENNII